MDFLRNPHFRYFPVLSTNHNSLFAIISQSIIISLVLKLLKKGIGNGKSRNPRTDKLTVPIDFKSIKLRLPKGFAVESV